MRSRNWFVSAPGFQGFKQGRPVGRPCWLLPTSLVDFHFQHDDGRSLRPQSVECTERYLTRGDGADVGAGLWPF